MRTLTILLSISFLLSACSDKNETITETKKKKNSSIVLPDSSLKNVKIIEVSPVTDADELMVVGEISFDEDNIVRIFPIVSGTVENISVSLGDYIKRGSQMATLISTDISDYQVNYNIAKSNLVVAEKNLKRIQELYNSNFASEKELTEAQNDFNNAKSEYEGKKKILELYGGTPNTNDAIFRVTAPIDGYVVERTVNNGTQIRTDNNSSMFIISDLKTVWVWANVYESDMSKISIGDSVEVTTVAYPDKKYKGIINKIGNTLDPEARVVKVRIDIENPGELLKPEMFATVAIRSNTSGKMLGVPKNAVFIENSKNYIIKVNGNTFTKTEIKQGKETAQYIEILEGLSEGEKIVTDGALFIASSINNQ